MVLGIQSIVPIALKFDEHNGLFLLFSDDNYIPFRMVQYSVPQVGYHCGVSKCSPRKSKGTLLCIQSPFMHLRLFDTIHIEFQSCCVV